MSILKKAQKYEYDIGLDQGAGAHLVAWASGLMVFFVTLALAVNLGLNTVTDNWVGGLSGSITVEIRPPADDGQQAAFDDSVKKILWMGKQHTSVESARALPRDQLTVRARN